MAQRLGDLLDSIDALDPDLTIYVSAERPLRLDSPAAVVPSTETALRPGEAAGMDYLLEVELAREVIDVWSVWRGGRAPTSDERLAAVVYYAERDAFLPVESG